MIRIEEIEDDKKRFLPLLLLGDEQESMIEKYLERGTLRTKIQNPVLYVWSRMKNRVYGKSKTWRPTQPIETMATRAN